MERRWVAYFASDIGAWLYTRRRQRKFADSEMIACSQVLWMNVCCFLGRRKGWLLCRCSCAYLPILAGSRRALNLWLNLGVLESGLRLRVSQADTFKTESIASGEANELTSG